MQNKSLRSIEDLLPQYERILLVNEDEFEEIKRSFCGENILIISNCDKIYRLLFEMYELYEFTDKIINLSNDYNWPTLSNYLNNGVISTDEFVKCITSYL